MYYFGPFSIHGCIFLSFSAYMQDIYFHDSIIARLATSHLWDNRDLPLVLEEITAAHEGSLTMRRATVKMVRDFMLVKFVKGCPTVLHTDQDYSQISFG